MKTVKMKQTLTTILAIIFISMVNSKTFAYDAQIDNIYYSLSGSEATVTCKKTSYKSYSGDIVIPESVTYNSKTYRVTSIGYQAFTYCDGLTSVTIPSSVTTIDSDAFCDCTKLTSVHITDLDAWCNINFANTYSNPTYYAHHLILNGNEIKCYTITDKFSAPDISALRYLNDLSLIFKCSKIGTLFKGEKGITSVVIGDEVTSIANNAFKGCTGIKSVAIGNGLKELPDNVFSGCILLSLTIGPNVQTIEKSSSLSENIKAEKVIWLTNTPPSGYENVTGTINYVSNNQYSELSNVKVYPFLSSLFEVDGVKYVPVSPSERTCDAIDCAYDGTVENVSIGETVSYKGISLATKEVNPYFGYNNTYIKTVHLSNQGNIGQYAFSGSDGISDVQISNQGNIMQDAFWGCAGLNTAIINNRGSIEDGAFEWCFLLETVELGTSITTIGSEAFRQCKKLKGISIPNSVTAIGSSAFSECNAMTYALLSDGIQTIPYDAFNNCSSLRLIQIPQNVTSIGDNVFKGCNSLANVIFNDGTNNLYLGRNLEHGISSPLFADCPLDSVYIGRNINYDNSPFYRNTSLRSVTITDKETEISQDEFHGCTNLKNVRIGDGVTTFGDWAFSGCSSLDYFSFGSSVETIGKEAFSDCAAMTRLISKAAVPPVCGSQALDDINKWKCILVVPQGYSSAYQQESQWKEFFFIEESNPTETILATGISLSQTTLSFNTANQSKTLTATVTPSNATNKNVKWTSSNTSVATVSDAGVVTSKANGTAIITAKTTDGTNLTATCTVTVDDTIRMDITTSNAGFSTFYDSHYAYILPNGLSAQVVTNVINNKLIYKTIAEGNKAGIVPKGTAVMLVGNEKRAKTYTLTATTGGAFYSGTNLLLGSDEATMTTGRGYHYKLSYGKTETEWDNVFGWYWGAQDGAPFQIEGNKAWLVVPKYSLTRSDIVGYTIDGDATGITGLESDDKTCDIYYDMQGRRISTPLKSGLYIINKKKVVIK